MSYETKTAVYSEIIKIQQALSTKVNENRYSDSLDPVNDNVIDLIEKKHGGVLPDDYKYFLYFSDGWDIQQQKIRIFSGGQLLDFEYQKNISRKIHCDIPDGGLWIASTHDEEVGYYALNNNLTNVLKVINGIGSEKTTFLNLLECISHDLERFFDVPQFQLV
jgi:hypothetical protein